MLVWLREYGHTDLMGKFGDWRRVLTNSGFHLRRPDEARGLSACEFVSRYGRGHSHTGLDQSDPFDPEGYHHPKKRGWLLGLFR